MSYILVTGDRHWTDKEMIQNALARHTQMGDVVLQGGNGYWKPEGRSKEWAAKDDKELMCCQRGADALAAQVCSEHGFPYETEFAQWSMYGRSAGPRRNEMMRKKAGIRLVLAFHPDIHQSKGTRDMCQRMHRDGILVLLHNEENPEGRPLRMDELREIR